MLTPTLTAPSEDLYPCPVFRTRERGGRNNLAMIIHLPISGSVQTWIERGVALVIENKVSTTTTSFLLQILTIVFTGGRE